MFFGLTLAHDKRHIVRSCMEGIILEQRDIIASIINNGIEIDTVRIIGGPTKSELWNQIQADIYNKPTQTLKVTDAAVLGAALAGLVGVGEYSNIEEAVGALVKPDKCYEPIAQNVKIYEEMFDLYTTVYEAMDKSGAYEKVAAIQRLG